MCTMYYSTNGCGNGCNGCYGRSSCGCTSFWNGTFQRMCRDSNGNIYVRNGSSCGCNGYSCYSGCCSTSQSLSSLSGDAYYERLYGFGGGCSCGCGST